MDSEVQVLKAPDDVLLIVADKAFAKVEGDIVTPVCICCGGPAHVTTGH